MMDEDGYPTDEELLFIEKYDLENGCYEEIMHYIEERWWNHYGWKEYEGNDELDEKPQYKFITMSTGGWSGNESIIRAMMKNLHLNCHEESWYRGGHYVFKFPLDKWEKKVGDE